MLEIAFYRWFLARLLEALDRDAITVHATTVVTTIPAGHVHSAGEVIVTPGQSILNARPSQPGEVALGRTLGDGARLTPPLFTNASTVPMRLGEPWLPAWPVMPPQAEGTSVAWDGPSHAAHAFYQAEDGLWDMAYTREDGSGFCPPLPTDATPVELTGVFARPTFRRCLADNKARPEHLGTDERFNVRLPVMAGVDANGRYIRDVKITLKTHEYRTIS